MCVVLNVCVFVGGVGIGIGIGVYCAVWILLHVGYCKWLYTVYLWAIFNHIEQKDTVDKRVL